MSKITNEGMAQAWEFAAGEVELACRKDCFVRFLHPQIREHTSTVIVNHLRTKAAIIRRNARLGKRRRPRA